MLLCVTGFVSAIFFSWWIPLVIMLLLSLRWRAWEVPLLGLLMDFLWLPAGALYFIPLCTILAVALLWVFEPLRTQLLV
jgi:hypothetical protein